MWVLACARGPHPCGWQLCATGAQNLYKTCRELVYSPNTHQAQKKHAEQQGVQSTDAARRARRRPPGLSRRISPSVISAIITACNRGSHVSWAARKGHPRVKQPRL